MAAIAPLQSFYTQYNASFSFTPVDLLAGDVLVVATKADGAITPSCSSGNLTFSLLGSGAQHAYWYAPVNSNLTAEQVTITFGASPKVGGQLIKISGSVTANPFIQTIAGTHAGSGSHPEPRSETVNLSALASASNTTLFFVAIGGGEATILTSHSTALDPNPVNYNTNIYSRYNEQGVTSFSYQLAGKWNEGRYLALEIREASGGAPETHTGTGTLSAQVATVAGNGSAFVIHSGAGSLTSQSAFVAGVAAAFAVHSGAGSLAAQIASIAGVGSSFVVHSGAGSLAADQGFISGSGVSFSVHSASGSLSAEIASVAGSGVANSIYSGVGSLIAQVASIQGVGALDGAIFGSGALSAQSAILTGDATIARVGSGSLESQPAQVSGVAAAFTVNTGSGVLTSQNASVSGAGSLAGAVIGSGNLISGVSTVAGVADVQPNVTITHVGSGDLIAGTGQAGSGLTAIQAQQLLEIHAAHFNRRNLIGNTITLYDVDGLTPIKTFTADTELTDINPNV